MSECPFCEIVAGRAPGAIVYEDEQSAALMDIYPVYAGHTLVIPHCRVGAAGKRQPGRVGNGGGRAGINQKAVAAVPDYDMTVNEFDWEGVHF